MEELHGKKIAVISTHNFEDNGLIYLRAPKLLKVLSQADIELEADPLLADAFKFGNGIENL